MDQPARRPLTVTAIVGTLVVVAVFGFFGWRERPVDALYWLFVFHAGPSAVLLLWLARLVLIRRPGNGAGRVLLAMGLLATLHMPVAAFTDAALTAAGVSDLAEKAPTLVPADLPLTASVAILLLNVQWVPMLVLAMAILPLVFPDGRLPGPRWRLSVAVAAVGATLVMTGNAIDGGPWTTWTTAGAPPVVGILIGAGGLCILASAVAGFTGLVIRWRRASPDQRQPFRLVGTTAFGLAIVMVATYPWPRVWTATGLVAFLVLLAAYSLAVARYRAHDLEPVLGKVAASAALSMVVLVAFLGIVVGVGSLVSSRPADTMLALLAMVVVAIAARPIHHCARQWSDRVVLGRRADRAEVVSQLAATAVDSSPISVAVDDAVGLLVRSTGATRVEARLDMPGGTTLRSASGKPAVGEPLLVAPVEYADDRLGELRLYSYSRADLAGDAPSVLEDVANVLGVAAHHAQVSDSLALRVSEVEAMGRRLVEAHDTARRGIERDLHDGAQARLLALRLRLGALRAASTADADAELADVLDEMDATIGALRDLARGVHPAVLRRSGLVAALTIQCGDLGVPVEVRAAGLPRFPAPIESAVYFACTEAVQNAVRHASATKIVVEITDAAAAVAFAVSDNGTGFDVTAPTEGTGLAGVADRVRALGGALRTESTPGTGARIEGTVPLAVQSPNAER